MQEFKEEKPDWLRIRPPSSDKYDIVKQTLAERGLNTVCASAKCPNAFECWDHGALTFMILGNVCTRACRFCAVAHDRMGEDVDQTEPDKIADAAKALGLSLRRDHFRGQGRPRGQGCRTIRFLHTRNKRPCSRCQSRGDHTRFFRQGRPAIKSHRTQDRT